MGERTTGISAGSFDKDKVKAAVESHMREKVMKVDEVDMQFWLLVTDVPQVTKPVAVIQAFLNFLIPGLGSAVAACATQNGNVSKTQLGVAFVQFLTGLMLVGWIWAIYWSYLIVLKAWNPDNGQPAGYEPANNFRG